MLHYIKTILITLFYILCSGVFFLASIQFSLKGHWLTGLFIILGLLFSIYTVLYIVNAFIPLLDE